MTEPELKLADDVPFFDYINIPPSLETMASFTVLRKIWFRYDADLIDENTGSLSLDSTQIRQKVCEDLGKLDLPKTVLDVLIRFSTVVEEELIKITKFLTNLDVKLNSCLDLKWTNWGTVDKSKTLEEIMQSEKYITYRHEQSPLSNLLQLESVLLHPRGPQCSCKLKTDEIIKILFMIAAQFGSEVACRHYLKNLAGDNKDNLIIVGVTLIIEKTLHKQFLISNFFCLLFFNMDSKHLLMDIVSKNEIIVTWLLSWPWKIFFEKYLEENYLEYFCKASQVHILKEKDYLLFRRLSKNVIIKEHFHKLLSEEL